MPRELPSASLVDVAQFNRVVVVPNAVQGLFRRRPAAVAVAVKADVDGAAVRLLAGMRRRYRARPVWIRLVLERALLLLSVEDIRRALEGSPEPFAADPPAKRKGMSHFQPHALTISRDGLWEERRRFTEAVLDTPEPVHRLGDRFVLVAREETAALLAAGDGRLDWDAWHAAWRRLVRRVVLGDAAAEDEEVTDLLAKLMSEANNLPDERSEHFGPFVERLRSYVEAAEPGSLASVVPHAPQTPATAATGQVPHWLFASADTLPANALRALVLILGHPPQREELQRELDAHGAGDGLDAATLADLSYLRACLMDAMRLYPTTPLLSRETISVVDFDGVRVPAGTQVLWVNLFHHRDRDHVPYADRFSPEAWTEGSAWDDWSFNHFSHGPQGCPGTYLALLLASAVLVEALSARGLRVEQPRIDPAQPLPHMLDVFRVRLAYDAVRS